MYAPVSTAGLDVLCRKSQHVGDLAGVLDPALAVPTQQGPARLLAARFSVESLSMFCLKLGRSARPTNFMSIPGVPSGMSPPHMAPLITVERLWLRSVERRRYMPQATSA